MNQGNNQNMAQYAPQPHQHLPLTMQPYVEILEQPASVRFRYTSEVRGAGSINGVRSTATHKPFTTIRVVGLDCEATLQVSLVCTDSLKVHPYELVGNGCDSGIYIRTLLPTENVLTLDHLSIHCTKKKEMPHLIRKRELTGVDPFKGGYQHFNMLTPDQLRVVRLCFQVFLKLPNGQQPLLPVLSKPIYDKRTLHAKVGTLDHHSIHCTKKKDIVSSIKKREVADVDPFKRGYHRLGTLTSAELKVVL